jgi:LruC domain-containing protein
MKRLFNIVNLFIVAVLLSVNTVNAQLTLDCESGNRALEQANCWGFGAVGYTNANNLIISGSWSTQSNQLTNPSLTASWIKSPWMKIGEGNITISTRLSVANGDTRQLVASYVPFDVNAGTNKEGTLTTFYTFNYPKNGNAFSLSVQNLVIPIPQAIANSPDIYKIMLSFVGTGGNSRAIADNLIIPGTYWSDPANNCLPIPSIVDTDKDGVADADDEYPTDNTRAYNNYFPSTFGTLAFEDNWPSKGDYDLNDIVVNYKINRVTNAANKVVEVIATFVARASGAGFRDAFGFQLDNIEPNKIVSVTGNKVGKVADVFKFGSNGLESNQQYANIIVFDNFYEVLKHPGSGSFINVTKNAPFVPYVTLTVTIKMQSNMPIAELPAEKFNFYIVADVLKKGRGTEIHLPDGMPSSLVNNSLFGTLDDNSTGAKYYRTENNLPWGINVVQGFDYMIEKVSIDKGYNNFIKWAESGGAEFQDWFEDKAGYRNPESIYRH